jgi:hypothetical protein
MAGAEYLYLAKILFMNNNNSKIEIRIEKYLREEFNKILILVSNEACILLSFQNPI